MEREAGPPSLSVPFNIAPQSSFSCTLLITAKPIVFNSTGPVLCNLLDVITLKWRKCTSCSANQDLMRWASSGGHRNPVPRLWLFLLTTAFCVHGLWEAGSPLRRSTTLCWTVDHSRGWWVEVILYVRTTMFVHVWSPFVYQYMYARVCVRVEARGQSQAPVYKSCPTCFYRQAFLLAWNIPRSWAGSQ